MQYFSSALDKDGDGNVTIDEIVEAQNEFFEKIDKIVKPIRNIMEKNKPFVNIVLGYTTLMYSGHFSHLFLCCGSVGVCSI